MEPRLTLITLGVADLDRARAFYRALGFPLSSGSQERVAFFRLNGLVLSLYPFADLAGDMGRPPAHTDGAQMALAYNTRSEAEVDAVLAEFTAAGGLLIRPAQTAFWGGYAGYAADPDGHVWEVAFNPHWRLDAEGRAVLPE